jgi:hypothetical protein
MVLLRSITTIVKTSFQVFLYRDVRAFPALLRVHIPDQLLRLRHPTHHQVILFPKNQNRNTMILVSHLYTLPLVEWDKILLYYPDFRLIITYLLYLLIV